MRGRRELQEKMPREARLRSEASAEKMISEMGLAELRAAMDMTQESFANALHVKQASISKMERRSDMYISTLNKIIEAMGGRAANRCQDAEWKRKNPSVHPDPARRI
jgi:DNA-binding transcriptional regulator YiaG